jgi:ABC-type phosphate/phosphonate transport system substrate-binding protein
MAELQFVSLMSGNALGYCRELTSYLSARTGFPIVLCGEQWQVAEQRLYRGEAHLGVVCGLQYVLAADRGEQPGVEVLAAPVMAGARYLGRPVYFSDVVVRSGSPVRSLDDLRGATWAYNEPTSHSGYAVTRFVLASRGHGRKFFGRVSGSGAHLRSLDWLLSARVDATAIDSTVLEQELRTRPMLASRIRVIETFGPSPIPPLVVSRGLAADARQALQSTLLEMHVDPAGQPVLSRARIDRFVAVADADYEPIRQMWRIGAEVEAWTDAAAAYAGLAR